MTSASTMLNLISSQFVEVGIVGLYVIQSVQNRLKVLFHTVPVGLFVGIQTDFLGHWYGLPLILTTGLL